MIDLEDELEATICTDQMGRFPFRSSRGKQCIVVMCEIDSGAILVESMRDRKGGELIRAHQVLLDRLEESGLKPKHHVLDNEASDVFKATIEKTR